MRSHVGLPGHAMFTHAFSRRVAGHAMFTHAFSRRVAGHAMFTHAFSRRVAGHAMFTHAFTGRIDGCASLLDAVNSYYSEQCTNSSGVLDTRCHDEMVWILHHDEMVSILPCFSDDEYLSGGSYL